MEREGWCSFSRVSFELIKRAAWDRETPEVCATSIYHFWRERERDSPLIFSIYWSYLDFESSWSNPSQSAVQCSVKGLMELSFLVLYNARERSSLGLVWLAFSSGYLQQPSDLTCTYLFLFVSIYICLEIYEYKASIAEKKMFIDQLAWHWVGVVKTTAKVCHEFRRRFGNLNVTIQSLPQGTVPLHKQTGNVHERIKSFLAVSRLCTFRPQLPKCPSLK